jgi:chromosome segregation ATPase
VFISCFLLCHPISAAILLTQHPAQSIEPEAMAAPSDACGLAEALFKQLNDLFKSNSFQQLNEIATENAELKKKKGEWEVTNRNNLESLVDLQRQLDAGKEEASAQATQLSKLTKEKEDIEAILAAKTKLAEETDKQLEAKKSEITTLTTTLKQAEASTGQLKKQKAEGDKSLAATKDDKAKLDKELAQLQADFAKQAARLSRLERLEHKLQRPQKDDLYVPTTSQQLDVGCTN